MSPGELAAITGIGAAVVGAAASAWFSSATARRDAQAVRVGERLGALEKANDYRDGYEAGRRAGLEEARKGNESR